MKVKRLVFNEQTRKWEERYIDLGRAHPRPRGLIELLSGGKVPSYTPGALADDPNHRVKV